MTTIMVDRMSPCKPNSRWRYAKSCHLFMAAPNLEALHTFAEGLGLKRPWLQQGSMPHYDLTESKQRLALEMGAVLVDGHVVVAVMRNWQRMCTKPKDRIECGSRPAGW